MSLSLHATNFLLCGTLKFFVTDIFYSFFVFSPEKIGELTDQMVGYNLTTKQTPPDGVLVQKVNNDSIRI